jgi:hypothetical protein
MSTGGFCDDAKSPVREVPLKSGFEQLRVGASRGRVNLPQTVLGEL